MRYSFLILTIFLFSFKPINTGNPQAKGLTAMWALDEQGGKYAYVKGHSGIGHGTLNGTSVVFKNNACSFTAGNSDFIQFGTTSTFNFTTKMSISWWFNRASGTLCHAGKYGGATTDKAYLLQIYSDNKVYWVIPSSAGADSYFSLTGTFTSAGWHMITATYDGTQSTNALKARVYMDGVLMVGTYVNTIPTSMNASTKYFEINRYNAATYGTCQMRDVRLYNYPLTQTQIQLMYLMPFGIYN